MLWTQGKPLKVCWNDRILERTKVHDLGVLFEGHTRIEGRDQSSGRNRNPSRDLDCQFTGRSRGEVTCDVLTPDDTLSLLGRETKPLDEALCLAGDCRLGREGEQQGDAESQSTEPAIKPSRGDQIVSQAGRAMCLRHGADLLKGSAQMFSEVHEAKSFASDCPACFKWREGLK